MSVVGNNLSVGFRRANGTVIAQVSGELDCYTADALRSQLHDVIDGQGNLAVELDLAGLTFMDSTGVSVLVQALQRLRERGGELTLHHPRPAVSKVFEILGLEFHITA